MKCVCVLAIFILILMPFVGLAVHFIIQILSHKQMCAMLKKAQLKDIIFHTHTYSICMKFSLIDWYSYILVRIMNIYLYIGIIKFWAIHFSFRSSFLFLLSCVYIYKYLIVCIGVLKYIYIQIPQFSHTFY